MTYEFLRAFMLVFIAELGDKSQIIAMTFATKYVIKDVIWGIFFGIFLNHGIAILLGKYLAAVVPDHIVALVAGLMFVFFAYTSLENEEVEKLEERERLNPIITVAIAFFIGELGDKTQLTAITLATESNYPLLILMGTILGMLVSSGLGILVGMKIGDQISELSIKISSSLMFLTFGCIKLYGVTGNYKRIYVYLIFVSLLLIELVLILDFVQKYRKRGKGSALKQAASNLYQQTAELKLALDSICIGENKCGQCRGADCLVGYIRHCLSNAREKDQYYKEYYLDVDRLIKKGYDKEKVMQALELIIQDYQEYGWVDHSRFVCNRIRTALEYILLEQTIEGITNVDTYIDNVKKINHHLGKRLENRVKTY